MRIFYQQVIVVSLSQTISSVEFIPSHPGLVRKYAALGSLEGELPVQSIILKDDNSDGSRSLTLLRIS